MGSSPKVEVQQPTPPAAPTATQTAQDYAAALPIYYQTAMQYEPQMAALEKQINEQLYPTTAGLQETIAGQANKALTSDVPQWWQDNAAEQMKSTFGRNLVYNPLAQEKYGVGLMQANENYKNYYQNMALSAAGRQPLAQSANIMQTFTPQANMGYNAQNYGNYSNAYTSMYGTNAQMAGQQMNYSNPWANAAGAIGGGISGAGTMGLGKAMKWW